MKRRFLAGLGIALAVAVAAPGLSTPASAGGTKNLTLAQILLSDSKKDAPNGFDSNPNDFDIVTQAILLFPDLVQAASNPGDYTVFLPTDYAFRRLVRDLTGKTVRKESDVFAAVAALGTDTVKGVLSYHIIAGARIDYKTALASDGAELTTLNGAKITVDVRGHGFKSVVLMDGNAALRDPRVIIPNIVASNGIAHGINRVLMPG